MSIIEAIFLGLVQGVTEFLPVSSSGHLVLVRHWLGFQEIDIIFDVFVHFATLLAIIIFFRRQLLSLKPRGVLLLLLGSLPAAGLGLLFRQQIEAAFTSVMMVGVALVATGVMNFILDRRLGRPKNVDRSKPEELSDEDIVINWKQALGVGLFQAFALLPGISRSGWTVAGAVLHRIPREQAFRFSFLLLIPVILGATALKVVEIINLGSVSIAPLSLFLGSVMAFVSGLLSLRVFRYVIREAKLELFGWYCVTIGSIAIVSQLG
jgi:undecaprenyl-diphosphatase